MYTSPRGIARSRLLLIIAAAALLMLSVAEQLRGHGFGWWSFALALIVLVPALVQKTPRQMAARNREERESRPGDPARVVTQRPDAHRSVR